MGEFELIRRYFATAARDASVEQGIGDDCAVLNPPPGEQLVVSIDTLVEGTHFLPGTPAARIAQRLLGAAVSDLAAMGARPAWFTLALTLPEADASWLESFAAALAQRAAELKILLVGGDTTRGPLALSVQVHGFVAAGAALLRSGARVDDLVAVTGTLGDSRAGLECLLQGTEATDEHSRWLLERFYCPEPRTALAQALAPWVHSAIDISDGLISDLGHILEASQCGAELELTQLPLSSALLACSGSEAQARQWALSGGEDFELCLTLPAAHWARCAAIAQTQGVALTPVGRITATAGLHLLNAGRPVESPLQGYDHFRRQDG